MAAAQRLPVVQEGAAALASWSAVAAIANVCRNQCCLAMDEHPGVIMAKRMLPLRATATAFHESALQIIRAAWAATKSV
jgi:hypothetical protein